MEMREIRVDVFERKTVHPILMPRVAAPARVALVRCRAVQDREEQSRQGEGLRWQLSTDIANSTCIVERGTERDVE